MLRTVRRYWPYVKDLGVALRPLRFGILGLLITCLVWTESYTGQGGDVLVAYHSGWWSPQSLQFVLGLLVLSLVTWLTMYAAILLRFKRGAGNAAEDEPDIMIAYRTQYPAPAFIPNSNDADIEARRRVRWILWWRKWVPPVLGCAGPLVTAIGLLNAVGVQAIYEYAFWVALVGGVVLFVVFRAMMPSDLTQSITVSWSDIRPRWAKWAPIVALAALLLGAAACWIDPVRWGLWLGPLPIFLGAVALLIVLGTLLAMISRESSLPIFSLIVIALVIWHTWGPDQNIRYLESANALDDVKSRPTPVEAFQGWLETKLHNSDWGVALAPSASASVVPSSS